MEFRFGPDRIVVNVPDLARLTDELHSRFRAGRGFALATINLDHLVKLRTDPDFRRAYLAHDLVVADGNPIVRLSRIAGRPVTLLPGSDLVIPTLRIAAGEGVRVGLVGSSDATLDAAAKRLRAAVPGLDIAVTISPPFGLDPEGAEAQAIFDRLIAAQVGFCILALSAPRQEQLAARGRKIAPQIGFAGFGAGLDFIAGRQTRAPGLVRKLGLEWLWRALGSPLRLGPRYLRCIAILPGQVLAAWRLRRSEGL